ncbi:MAG: EAL domain-containing response regulator [Myxococcota bacterium]
MATTVARAASGPEPIRENGRILVVDDDPQVCLTFERILVRRGWAVVVANDGLEAKDLVMRTSFDVIISDVHMPGHGGLKFLQGLREHDLDVPVVLISGEPSLESSLRAIEYGVFRYLAKPVTVTQLEEVVSRAARLHRMARLKQQALEVLTDGGGWAGDRAALAGHFVSALENIWMGFQPIVSWGPRAIYGFEALLRSDEPALRSPDLILGAAERLGRLIELGRAVRAKVAESATRLPGEAKLFVNLHAADLADDDLVNPRAPLSQIAGRVVLEITERASLAGLSGVGNTVRKLRDMGYTLAIDDLGAGYAGLTSFTHLEPRVVKLDMGLIRDIDTQPRKQSVVRAMRDLCHELDIAVISEGVETQGERDMLAALGCDLMQGYLFARPERGFPSPAW